MAYGMTASVEELCLWFTDLKVVKQELLELQAWLKVPRQHLPQTIVPDDLPRHHGHPAARAWPRTCKGRAGQSKGEGFLMQERGWPLEGKMYWLQRGNVKGTH
ncbi:hypothetical protein ABBQ32_002508 [Trebouxia sp. C0010 RCD-2024]